MMIPLRYLVPALTIAVLIGCGGGAEVPAPDAAADHAAHIREAMARIRAQEDSLFALGTFDRKGAMALRDVYLAFAKNEPLDTMTPEYIFRAASVSRTLGEPQKTLDLYDRIIQDYPGWRRLVDTYYLRAFTIDNDMGKKGEAKTAYEEVIHRFPDHKFATEARQMIENLPYTDEQLIERFKKMNQQGDTAATGL